MTRLQVAAPSTHPAASTPSAASTPRTPSGASALALAFAAALGFSTALVGASDSWAADPAPGAARAADPASGGSPAAGAGGQSARTAGSGDAAKEQPPSRLQGAIEGDKRQAEEPCSTFTGQARDACEARAAATAESPRGRQGADPTGKGNPAATTR